MGAGSIALLPEISMLFMTLDLNVTLYDVRLPLYTALFQIIVKDGTIARADRGFRL